MSFGGLGNEIQHICNEQHVILPSTYIKRSHRVNHAKLKLAIDADQGTAEATALADPAIVRALAGDTPRRVIVVPNRIVNVVI